MKNPKVLVAAPISSLKLYVWEEFAHALSFLNYKNKEILLVETDGNTEMQGIIRNFGFKCETLNSNKKMMDKVVDGRNFIRDYALKQGFDYVLMLDADIILPENIVESLLAHNKDFVSAVVFGMDKYGGPEIVARTTDEDNDAYLYPFPVENLFNGLQGIVISGMGCALLSKKILEDIEFRCVRDKDGKLKVSEDYCFSFDSTNKGYEIFLDTDIQVKHKISGDWDWDKA